MKAIINTSNTYRLISHMVKDGGGKFPNNNILPLLIYKNVIQMINDNPNKQNCHGENMIASKFEQILSQNEWGNSWRDGIYPYHHYHSTAHEALGVYSGTATVQFGGGDDDKVSIILNVQVGDLILIPAGVAHKSLECSDDFGVVGAYPSSDDSRHQVQQVDMNYGKPDERPTVDQTIAKLPLPTQDPIFGKSGPVIDLWKTQKRTNA